LITATKLEKSYGETAVLRGLDLQARPGETLALLGRNGAGKTTLLRILATLTRPDSGEVRVDGIDIARNGELARQVTGVVLHSPMLYGDLTVVENLMFFGKMFRLDDTRDRAMALLRRVEMERRADVRARALSHGQQKRVALARALLHEPRILVLDEPESGLDQRAREALAGIVDEFRSSGRTVIMTTHELVSGLRMADRVAVIEHGKVAYEKARGEFDVETVRARFGDLVETG
jgi:heme ABC exporter ATP-binding subunit CcmA